MEDGVDGGEEDGMRGEDGCESSCSRTRDFLALSFHNERVLRKKLVTVKVKRKPWYERAGGGELGQRG